MSRVKTTTCDAHCPSCGAPAVVTGLRPFKPHEYKCRNVIPGPEGEPCETVYRIKADDWADGDAIVQRQQPRRRMISRGPRL